MFNALNPDQRRLSQSVALAVVFWVLLLWLLAIIKLSGPSWPETASPLFIELERLESPEPVDQFEAIAAERPLTESQPLKEVFEPEAIKLPEELIPEVAAPESLSSEPPVPVLAEIADTTISGRPSASPEPAPDYPPALLMPESLPVQTVPVSPPAAGPLTAPSVLPTAPVTTASTVPETRPSTAPAANIVASSSQNPKPEPLIPAVTQPLAAPELTESAAIASPIPVQPSYAVDLSELPPVAAAAKAPATLNKFQTSNSSLASASQTPPKTNSAIGSTSSNLPSEASAEPSNPLKSANSSPTSSAAEAEASYQKPISPTDVVEQRIAQLASQPDARSLINNPGLPALAAAGLPDAASSADLPKTDDNAGFSADGPGGDVLGAFQFGETGAQRQLLSSSRIKLPNSLLKDLPNEITTMVSFEIESGGTVLGSTIGFNPPLTSSSLERYIREAFSAWQFSPAASGGQVLFRYSIKVR